MKKTLLLGLLMQLVVCWQASAQLKDNDVFVAKDLTGTTTLQSLWDQITTSTMDTSLRIMPGKQLSSAIYVRFLNTKNEKDSIVNIAAFSRNIVIFFVYGSRCIDYTKQIHEMDSFMLRFPSEDLVTITIRADSIQENIPRNVPLFPFKFQTVEGDSISVQQLFPQFKNGKFPLIAFVDKGLNVRIVKEGRFKDIIKTIPALRE